VFPTAARRRIADEKLGIAAIYPQHFKALVPGLIADFEQVHAALNGGRYERQSESRMPEIGTSGSMRARESALDQTPGMMRWT
jgi:hypothetical protein